MALPPQDSEYNPRCPSQVSGQHSDARPDNLSTISSAPSPKASFGLGFGWYPHGDAADHPSQRNVAVHPEGSTSQDLDNMTMNGLPVTYSPLPPTAGTSLPSGLSDDDEYSLLAPDGIVPSGCTSSSVSAEHHSRDQRPLSVLIATQDAPPGSQASLQALIQQFLTTNSDVDDESIIWGRPAESQSIDLHGSSQVVVPDGSSIRSTVTSALADGVPSEKPSLPTRDHQHPAVASSGLVKHGTETTEYAYSSIPRCELSTTQWLQPTPNETPRMFFLRAAEQVPSLRVLTILSEYADCFYIDALRAGMDQFNWTGDPIDMAMRKFLRVVDLPHDAQHVT